ncbi:hypothetical protein QFZ64_001920 [Streptomyces sp. B3I8]|nr:hypothetical protein [Streptomyces sp. B3I8]
MNMCRPGDPGYRPAPGRPRVSDLTLSGTRVRGCRGGPGGR